MLNPQEEAPVEAADDLLIDQLEVIPPPQGSPIYLMVEGVPLDQLIDPENEAIPDQEAYLFVAQLPDQPQQEQQPIEQMEIE